MKEGDNKNQRNSFQYLFFTFSEKIDISIHFSLVSPKLLLVFRVVAFFILSYRYYLQMTNIHSFFVTFEFLTELGFHLTWIYFSTVCLDYLLNQIPFEKISIKLRDWVNLMFETVWCIQFVVTIIFWTVLYDPNQQQTTRQLLLNIGVHGFPLLCLLIDFIMNSYQFPKRHLLFVVLVGLGYMLVNMSKFQDKVGYSLSTKPVYDPIDWASSMCYIYLVICAVLIIVIHVLSRIIWLKLKKTGIQKAIAKKSSYMFSMKEQLLE